MGKIMTNTYESPKLRYYDLELGGFICSSDTRDEVDELNSLFGDSQGGDLILE